MLAVIFMAASCEKESLIQMNGSKKQKTTGTILTYEECQWHGFSTNLEMEDMSAESLMQQDEDILIIKNIYGDVCWRVNGELIGTLEYINCVDGYMMYCTDDVEITLEGVPTDATIPNPLPQGQWLMFGCPYQFSMPTKEAYNMPDYAEPFDIVKSVPDAVIHWEYYGIFNLSTIAPFTSNLVRVGSPEGLISADVRNYNGLDRILTTTDKDGTCGIQILPSYLDIHGNICEKEFAVAYLDEELGVVYL